MHLHQIQRRVRSLALFVALIGAILLPIAPAAAKDAAKAKKDNTYLVQRHESLAGIAYDLGTNTETLRLLNQMTTVDVVWTGQVLKTPPMVGTVAYVAKADDTLASIAARFGQPLAKVIEASQLSPATRLTAGQLLFVPVEGNPLSEELLTYAVRRGESLASIARKFGTSADAIARINNIKNINRIAPGVELLMPPINYEDSLADTPPGELGVAPIAHFPTETEKWIQVDLSEQRVVAWEGKTPVKTFIISSGRAATPTVTGVFRLWAKVAAQNMAGGSKEDGTYYFLRNVQWVQYFYRDYSFHGTYWHNNFGHPMSHGCVNMRNEDALWLYDWAAPENPNGDWLRVPEDQPGTLVVVHL